MQQWKNKIKAFLLLLVFSLNTVVGFACSIGINMGYNSSHHRHSFSGPAEKAHSHNLGHKHSSGASHTRDHQHKHTKEDGAAKNTQDDCCANDVTKFIRLDKSVVKTNLDLQMPTFSVALTSKFFQPWLNENNFSHSSVVLPFRRSCSLHDTDIRTAIQSFQI